jgi:hypothetical protein
MPVDFEQLEALLLSLALRVGLAGRTAASFDEYIDHGEYGLALDSLALGMIEGGRSPNAEELGSARAIAEMMLLDVDEVLDEARSRAQHPD